jgi:anti-sigma factor RsiW
MICNHVLDLLPFLDDGSLSPQLSKEVMEHLAECDNCSGEYHKLNSMIQFVRETISEQAPVPDSKYMDMLNRRIKKKKTERTTVLWAVPAAAAIFLAVFMGIYSMFPGDGRTGFAAGKKHSKGQSVMVVGNKTSDVDVTYHSLTTYANVSIDDMIDSMDESEISAILDSDER